MSGSDFPHEDEDRPAGPVQDSEALLREGRRFQMETGIPPFWGRKPRFWPWALLAVLLVLISLGIEIFWPLPGRHGPLPTCGQEPVGTVSCQRPQAPAVTPGSSTPSR